MNIKSIQATILLSVISLFLFQSCFAQQKILAVFAHPDDETTITPVLAEYASKGYDITVLIATDGRYGVTDHAGIPAGDGLIEVRKEEIKCSCEAIGINPPILLKAHDGMNGLEGVGAQFGEFAYLQGEILRVINDIKPDILITMGPEGDSGHPDHRIVSAILTQLYFANDWSEKIDLYYCAWSEKQAKKYGDWNLHPTHSKYLNTQISYSPESEQKHFEAIKCYKSQYSQDEMKHWINLDKNDPLKVIYFRKVVTDDKVRTSF